MIRIGRGKYKTVAEGLLRIEPKPPAPPSKPAKGRPRATRRPMKLTEGAKSHLPETQPGWAAWRGRVRSLDLRLMPAGSYGRPAGLPQGFTRATLKEFTQMLEQDPVYIAIMEMLEKENPIVQVTMRFHLQVLMGEYGIKEKQNAAKELNLYYKSKPATLNEQKVTLSADEAAWEDDLEEFAAEGTEWSQKPN